MLNVQHKKIGFFVNPKYLTHTEDDILHVVFHRKNIGATVKEDALFIDAEGQEWWIRKGDEINGASVPRLFWRIFTPYGVGIREASAFHDVYCVFRLRSQKDTHRMFWEAQRCNGVSPFWAFITWLSVRVFCKLRYRDWK